MTGLPIQSFTELRYYKNLTKLVWRNLSNEDLALLLMSYANPNITYLDLSRDVCDESKLQSEHLRKRDIEMTDPIEAIPITGELPPSFISRNLTYLNISGTIRLTDRKRMWKLHRAQGVQIIDMGNKRLKSLTKNHPHLTDLRIACTGLTSVDQLAKLTALTSLDVSNNYLDGRDWREIIYKFPAITKLNISRNELQDGDVQLLFRDEFEFPFTELVVEPQKTHYITQQTLRSIADRVNEKTIQEKKQSEIEYENVEVIPKSQQELGNLLTLHPNVQMLGFDVAGHRGRLFTFQVIPKLKHLRSLRLNGNFTITPDVFKSKTCTKIILVDCDLGFDWGVDRGVAKAIQKNNVLQQLQLDRCMVAPNVLLAILKHQSISRLTLNFVKIVDGVFDTNVGLAEILKNDALLHFESNFIETDGIDTTMFLGNEEKLIETHLAENRRKLQVMQMLPLIAATQLGGTLRHSILNVPLRARSAQLSSETKHDPLDPRNEPPAPPTELPLEMISRFMGQPPLERGTAKAVSELVEPVVRLGMRTRQQTAPLPLMFDPVLYEKSKQ